MVNKIIEKDPLMGYKLIPLNANCRNLDRTKPPIFSNSCWYKVLEELGKDKEFKEEFIGYAMISVVAKEKSPIDEEAVRKCMQKIRKNLVRAKPICYQHSKRILQP